MCVWLSVLQIRVFAPLNSCPVAKDGVAVATNTVITQPNGRTVMKDGAGAGPVITRPTSTARRSTDGSDQALSCNYTHVKGHENQTSFHAERDIGMCPILPCLECIMLYMCQARTCTVIHLHLHLHLGFVDPLQDVALHQCLPSWSVCCFTNPGGSLLLRYVILPSSAWSSSRPLPSPRLPICASLCSPIVF